MLHLLPVKNITVADFIGDGSIVPFPLQRASPTPGGQRRQLFAKCHSQLGPQQLHGALPILELRALLLTKDADARRLMHQVHRRFDLVHVLAWEEGGNASK